MNIYRQGDVLVLSVNSIPAEARAISRDADRVVLAYGEVTGHAHVISGRDVQLFSAPDTEDRFLRIMGASGVDLQHDEHSTITLPPGDYRVRIQREYCSKDMAPVKVLD